MTDRALLFEALALLGRVVQLGIRVAHFLLADEQLEALGQPRSASVPENNNYDIMHESTGDERLEDLPLGERTHDLRMARDEGWVDALLFQVVADQLQYARNTT